MKDFLAIGTIANTHGVRGELKVLPLTSDVGRFDYLKFVNVMEGDNPKEYRVESTRLHKQFILMKLSGVDTMDKAEALKGRELLVERKFARPLEEDEFFICDLIGLSVYEGDKLLGKLTEVLETGSNDVYIVSDEDKNEILLPALKSVVTKVDLEEGRMEVIIPEGLLDEV